MSNQIERLRYYDGEYLRSYDFTDEQAYHIEMRRRLNHRLHLHGIVYGLQLVLDQDSLPPPAPQFFSISPGMAIDQVGREVLVPAPYSLSSENVLNRPGLNPGETYEVWLCYREAQTGLPAAGYRDCIEKNQQTRWQETFQVTLKPMNPSKNSYIPPDCGGVRLGTVTLDKNDNSLIVSMTNTGRVFVGIRAQRVIAADQEPDTTFKVENQNVDPAKRVPLPGYVEVEPGVFARSNLIVEKNVVIGDDFPGATDPPLPKPKQDTGNLKVTNDLFLNGDVYVFVDGKWFLLKDYVQTLTPTVVSDVATIDFSSPTAAQVNNGYVTRTVPVSLDSKLPRVTKIQKIFVALNEIVWLGPVDLSKYSTAALTAANNKPVLVSIVGPNPPAPASSINFFISATVGPAVTVGPNPMLPIGSVSVSCFAVFVP